MSTAIADLRYALRGLRRSPLFASVAILSLALGIGANTAIFTLIDQILLRKLPVQRPDELVMLYQQGTQRQQHGLADALLSALPGLPAEGRTAGGSALPPSLRRVASASTTNRAVDAEMVSGNYFSMLGVKPAPDASSIRRKTTRSTRAIRSSS